MLACILGWVENNVRLVIIQLTVSFIRCVSIMQNLTRIEVEISKMIDTLIQK